MPRFITVDSTQGSLANNADEWIFEEEWESGWHSYLLDTKTNDIVFSDRMEPEDATLGRDLRRLVNLLNDIDSES